MDDIGLRIEVGRDIDGGIGDDVGFRIAPNIHNEAMADATLGVDSTMRRNDSPHQFVRVEASLHQSLYPARGDQRDGSGRNPDCGPRRRSQLQPSLLSGVSQSFDRADQDGFDEGRRVAADTPPIDAVSQGCTTATLIGGCFCAAEMSCSYLPCLAGTTSLAQKPSHPVRFLPFTCGPPICWL